MKKDLMKKEKGKKVIIYDVDQISFIHPDGSFKTKLVLLFKDSQARCFTASDIWLIDKGIKPLYYKGLLMKDSETIVQLLEFLDAASAEELIGKQIYTAPDKMNFLVPVCFDPYVTATKTPFGACLKA